MIDREYIIKKGYLNEIQIDGNAWTIVQLPKNEEFIPYDE